MPVETPNAPTQAPSETQASESPPEQQPVAQTPAAEGEQQPVEAQPAFDPGALTPEQRAAVLRSLDVDEAIRLDERLSGKVGALAQQQALRKAEELLPQLLDRELPRILADIDARNAQAREAQRLDEVVQKGDAFGALELAKQQRERHQRLTAQQQQQQAQMAQLTRQQLDQEWEKARAEFLAQPEAVRKAIGYDKQYGTDPVAALMAFKSDLAEAKADYLAEQKANTDLRPKLEEQIRRDLEPALRKQILAELNGAEPSPDTGGGGAPPAGEFMPQEEWDRHKNLPRAEFRSWYAQNRARIVKSVTSGRLRE